MGVGKKTQKELSIYSTLKEMLGTDTKVYYIMFKFCPEQLLTTENKTPIKTFGELKNRYAVFTQGVTEKICERYLLEENVQSAVRWLLKRLHQEKLIKLYQTYYEKALSGDVQAFKAFTDFSEKFFADAKQDDLKLLLNKIPDKDIKAEEEEDYSYTYTE